MKFFPYLLFLIVPIWILTGCVKKAPEPTYSLIPLSNATLLDSIGKLDSLVSTIKASNNHQAHIYSRQALSIALRMNSEEALARAFLMMGITYFNFNNDSSFIYYSKALRIADRYDLIEIKPKIYYNLAMIYRDASDTKTAFIFLDSSIVFAQKVKDYGLLSNAYNALGNLKFNLLDMVDAKVLYDSAYNIAVRHALAKQMGIAMASLSRFEKDPDGSSEMRKKAIEILKKQSGNEEEIALILVNLGTRSSNPDTAIKYYQSAIKISQSGNFPEVEIAAYNNMAYCFIDKKNFRDAELSMIEYAIPLAKRVENFDWLSNLYDTYTDVLQAQNRIGEALTYARKALNARTKADKKQAADQVRLLAALLDVKKRELRIQTNEKELQKKENKIHLMNFWFSVSLMALLIVLFFIIWKFQRNKIKFQTELIESAKRLIESEENLKGRVSLELHDLTTPFYTTILHQIEEAKIKDFTIENELKNKLSDMAGSIRQISHRMNNNFIEQLTIKELVYGLCEDLRNTSTTPIHCMIGQDNFNLTGEETIHIYRIVQELLTNAIKYVSFGAITLSLSEEEGMFFIFYQDTGPGFDVKTTGNKGLGVMNIFERSKIINGKAVLNAFPGKGTKWNIIIPLKRDKKKSLLKNF